MISSSERLGLLCARRGPVASLNCCRDMLTIAKRRRCSGSVSISASIIYIYILYILDCLFAGMNFDAER